MQVIDETQQADLYESNLKELSNVIEVAVNALSSMAGGIISANLNGENLNKQTLATIVGSKINSRLHGRGVIR